MLITLSPAKAMDMETSVAAHSTQPDFQDDAVRLAKTARNLTLDDLKKLMKISDDLARLNRDRFRDFVPDPAPEATRPAAFAFAGDTYKGFEAATLDEDALHWAQDHVRILSGLYGVLRPLDAIQPYRLEMGSRLKTRRGGSLYAYWGDQIAKALRAQAADLGTDILVNCASTEYFTAADRPALGLRIITPVFMEDKPGGPKIVSFYAKQARGAMARWAAEAQPSDPEALKGFDTGGYAYREDLSEGDRWVFLREAAA